MTSRKGADVLASTTKSTAQDPHDAAQMDEAFIQAELQQELALLQREKMLLQQRLRRSTLHTSIHSTSITKATDSEQSLLTDQVAEALEANTKKAKVCEYQRAYRLAGCAVFPMDPATVGVRFETSYQGQYFEEYFAVLRLKNERFTLSRHTLPGFLPLQALATSAETNLTSFLQDATRLLQSFVARREQLQLLKPISAEHELHVSPSCTTAEFLSCPCFRMRWCREQVGAGSASCVSVAATRFRHC
eukprot:m.151263 g.151263  ORF g.151263 m.151263 type:complete len:247 (+) comp16195_c0_seq15:185-925(+)